MHGGETGFAHHALEHQAAGDAGADFFARLQLIARFAAMRGLQGGCAVLRLEIIGKSHRAASGLALAQRLELFTALGNELVFILRLFAGGRGIGVIGLCHGGGRFLRRKNGEF